MSLPVLKRPGRVPVFYTQRVDGRPFVNCLPYSICTVLRWIGYDVPTDYGMTIRQATGIPVAPHVGTSYSAMRKALAKLLPTAPVSIGWIDDSQLLAQLARPGRRNNKRIVASVPARMQRLPEFLRRQVGVNWQGLHALCFGGYRLCNGPSTDEVERHADHLGVDEVFVMDPMGRPWADYTGVWAPWSQVEPALGRNASGQIRSLWGMRKTAVP